MVVWWKGVDVDVDYEYDDVFFDFFVVVWEKVIWLWNDCEVYFDFMIVEFNSGM